MIPERRYQLTPAKLRSEQERTGNLVIGAHERLERVRDANSYEMLGIANPGGIQRGADLIVHFLVRDDFHKRFRTRADWLTKNDQSSNQQAIVNDCIP